MVQYPPQPDPFRCSVRFTLLSRPNHVLTVSAAGFPVEISPIILCFPGMRKFFVTFPKHSAAAGDEQQICAGFLTSFPKAGIMK